MPRSLGHSQAPCLHRGSLDDRHHPGDLESAAVLEPLEALVEAVGMARLDLVVWCHPKIKDETISMVL